MDGRNDLRMALARWRATVSPNAGMLRGMRGGARRRAFFLIADITGYTRFLTQMELEHANAILAELFDSLLGEIRAPLRLANVQGDALLMHLPDDGLSRGALVLEALERLYGAFADKLAAMQASADCACGACGNLGELDLKIIVHYGEYVTREIAGREQLHGADIIRAYRLLKNEATQRTGIKAYALLSEPAAAAIAVPEFFAGLPQHVEFSAELGDIAVHVYDLQAARAAAQTPPLRRAVN